MNCEKSVVKWHVKGTISIKKCKFWTQDLLLLQHFFSGGIFTEQEVMMWHGEEISRHLHNIFHRKEIVSSLQDISIFNTKSALHCFQNSLWKGQGDFLIWSWWRSFGLRLPPPSHQFPFSGTCSKLFSVAFKRLIIFWAKVSEEHLACDSLPLLDPHSSFLIRGSGILPTTAPPLSSIPRHRLHCKKIFSLTSHFQPKRKTCPSQPEQLFHKTQIASVVWLACWLSPGITWYHPAILSDSIKQHLKQPNWN